MFPMLNKLVPVKKWPVFKVLLFEGSDSIWHYQIVCPKSGTKMASKGKSVIDTVFDIKPLKVLSAAKSSTGNKLDT
jgi:hypothetical protein